MTTGRGFVDALASETAGVEPRHRGGDTALIQINQPFRRDGLESLEELFAPLKVRFRVALDGME